MQDGSTLLPDDCSAAGNPQAPPLPRNIEVFGRDLFLCRMMGDEELAREVITQFLTDLPTVIRDLQQQIAESDLISIGKSAHRIKGSAANVGGEALADAASRLEQAAKSGDWAEAALSAKNVAWEATRLQEILNGWE